MTTEQTSGASSPSASSAELERLLDEWADAAGHIWMTRSGEQATAWHVRREDLAQLARAAIAAERERICAAIKAEDDHCADGDYMMDSDDCIKVVRGTWIRPDWNGSNY